MIPDWVVYWVAGVVIYAAIIWPGPWGEKREE